MRTITLGEITNIKTGKLDANAKVEGGKYPFFTCSKEISWIDIPSYDCECILVAGNGDLNVKYYKGKFDAYQRTYIIESNGKKDLDMKYLYYFIEGYMETLRGQTIGGVIQYIKMNNLTDIEMPLPPISIQQAIATKLDKLQFLIELKKQAIAKTDDLAKAVFLEMFGDPMTNEKGWEIKKLNNLVYKLGDGLHGTPEYNENGEYYFINGNNLKNGRIEIFDNTKRVDYIQFEKYKKELNKDTILVSINGTLGNVAFYNGEKIILGKSACYFNLESSINKLYLYYVLKSDFFKDYATKSSTGSTIQNVSLKTMRESPIPLPPLSLQQKFADIITKLEKTKEQHKQALAKLEDLYQSEMQRSFSM